MKDDLDPLDPSTAKQMYLSERRQELADATLQSHHYRLKQFVQWCEREAIENLNDLCGRDIHRFRVERREEDELTNASMKGQLATLRMFLRFCATIDGVEPGLDEKILLLKMTSDDARDEMIRANRARDVLEFLERYRFATLEHVLLEVLWHTGLRIGAATGLDIEDYDSDDQFLELVHRPSEGTPLKNGENSERLVAVSEPVCHLLDEWLAVNHPDVIDDHGREPLFATYWGRVSNNRGRTIAYQFTRPCVYSHECPHDRVIDECEAQPTREAHRCPSALSPHPFRRGAITCHLQKIPQRKS
jgi:site-specific recombinase XerD